MCHSDDSTILGWINVPTNSFVHNAAFNLTEYSGLEQD